VRQFAERLRLTIARTAFPPLSGGQAVTVSFGAAERRSGEEMWELFVGADVALYEAKSAAATGSLPCRGDAIEVYRRHAAVGARVTDDVQAAS